MTSRRVHVLGWLSAVLVAAGCATTSPSGSPSAATESAVPGPTQSSSTVPDRSASTAAHYTTTKFSIPLSIDVAPLFGAGAPYDTPGLVSWTSTSEVNDKVRILAPVEVYPPGATTPEAVPADLVAYLKGLAEEGAVITDVTQATVGGKPATLLTATTSTSLDGVLGCPEAGADKGEGCYGLQPELLVRIAVANVDGKPLLAWARTDAATPNKAFIGAFEDMLATVEFQ